MPNANCYHQHSDSTDYTIGSALDLIWGFSHRHYCKDHITSSTVEFSIGSAVVNLEEEDCQSGSNNYCCTGNDRTLGPCFAEYDASSHNIIVEKGNKHGHWFGIKFEFVFNTAVLGPDINDNIKAMYTY